MTRLDLARGPVQLENLVQSSVSGLPPLRCSPQFQGYRRSAAVLSFRAAAAPLQSSVSGLPPLRCSPQFQGYRRSAAALSFRATAAPLQPSVSGLPPLRCSPQFQGRRRPAAIAAQTADWLPGGRRKMEQRFRPAPPRPGPPIRPLARQSVCPFTDSSVRSSPASSRC